MTSRNNNNPASASNTLQVERKLANLKADLKQNLVQLTDDVIEICPDDLELIFARTYLMGSVDDTQLANSFVEHVLPWKTQIKDRDEAFFRDNDHIFGALPEHKVQHFKTLWFTNHFNDDDKTVIWQYFDVFVGLAESYSRLSSSVLI